MKCILGEKGRDLKKTLQHLNCFGNLHGPGEVRATTTLKHHCDEFYLHTTKKQKITEKIKDSHKIMAILK